jgi:heme/copper-type cytochrome/quinol oxidase subunit 2
MLKEILPYIAGVVFLFFGLVLAYMTHRTNKYETEEDQAHNHYPMFKSLGWIGAIIAIILLSLWVFELIK